MKIKQKLNLGFIIVIALIVIPVGVSVFGLSKVKFFYESTEKLNNLSDLFFKERLLIDSYSHILMMEELGDVAKNEKLSTLEKTFLNDYNKANDLISALRNTNNSDESDQIISKLHLGHASFREVFERLKEVFVNIKISEEKISLRINSVKQKRDAIKNLVFSEELKIASTTQDFFYVALSKYNEIKNLESSYFFNEQKKESLNTLLFSVNNFETYIKESSLFNEQTSVFLLFKEYTDDLELFFAESNYKNLDDYSIDLEIRKLDDHITTLLVGDNNNGLLRLKEIQGSEIRNIFLFLLIFNLLFVIIIVSFGLAVSRKISKIIIGPLQELRDFSSKIGRGIEHVPLSISSNDEMSELAKVFNRIDTKLKQTNNDLLEKINELKIKDNIEALVEALTDGIIMYDREKNIVLMNTAVKKILNISNRKLSLKNLYSIFAKHNLEFHIDLSLKTNEIYRIDNVDLLGRKYEVVVTQATDYNNKIVGGLMIFHLKENQNNAIHEDDTRVDFGPVISPHFGTPLSYIKLFTEMLLAGEIGPLNKEQKESISNIHRSAINMKEVIDKLHDIKVLNDDELEIQTKEIEIVPYLKNLIKDYTQKNNIKSVDFNFKELLPSEIKINIDRKILSKVFEDILDNAVIYSKDNNAFVDIELKELGFNYLLSVKDKGIGIPEEEQDYIFDKLFRSSNAITRNTNGSGISLYIAKRLLNKVGAELFFESKLGEGTTFFIEIPKGGMRK